MTQHYKDANNNIYGYKPADIEVTAITMAEVNHINESKITPEQKAQARISELKQLLNNSDHKDLPNYKPKQGEDLVEVIAERDAWRNEIRQLEQSL